MFWMRVLFYYSCMSYLTRLLAPPVEKRAHPSSNEAWWSMGSFNTAAGVDVTIEGSLVYPAVLACVRVLAEDVATLPLILYERLRPRGKRRATTHALFTLLHDAPNPEMTSVEYRETSMVHLTLWGNAYSEIEFDKAGRILALWPLRPDRMRIERRNGHLTYLYRVQVGGAEVPLSAASIMHVRGMGSDGVYGYSPIALARQAVGLGLAAEEFGARFFSNGARPGGVLQHPGALSDLAYSRLKTSWDEEHRGLEAAQRVSILEEGMSYHQIGVPPEDAQFLETRRFQVNEIARLYRIPPHKIGDLERATFSNVEQQSIDYVVSTLRPWLVRWEQALLLRLLTPRERELLAVEFKVDGLLRGDTATRYQAYATARQWGWMSANDVRELENMNPVDDGDIYLTPLNMMEAGNEPADAVGAPVTRALAGGETRAATKLHAAAQRNRLAKTYRLVLASTAQRIVNREVNDIGNAARRLLGSAERSERRGQTEFDEWLTGFYEEHRKFIISYLGPMIQTYTDLVLDRVEAETGMDAPRSDMLAYAGGILVNMANMWIGRSEKRVHKALEGAGPAEQQQAVEAELKRMQENQADDFAQDASVRVNNAVAVRAYAAIGVLSKRWVAFGDNCPYCNELNGRTIEIGINFLGLDDLLHPAGAEPFRSGGNIGAAPLHAGCDCMVVAG